MNKLRIELEIEAKNRINYKLIFLCDSQEFIVSDEGSLLNRHSVILVGGIQVDSIVWSRLCYNLYASLTKSQILKFTQLYKELCQTES